MATKKKHSFLRSPGCLLTGKKYGENPVYEMQFLNELQLYADMYWFLADPSNRDEWNSNSNNIYTHLAPYVSGSRLLYSNLKPVMPCDCLLLLPGSASDSWWCDCTCKIPPVTHKTPLSDAIHSGNHSRSARQVSIKVMPLNTKPICLWLQGLSQFNLIY